MILENQISSLIGEISTEENEERKTELDEQYNLKLKELVNLKREI